MPGRSLRWLSELRDFSTGDQKCLELLTWRSLGQVAGISGPQRRGQNILGDAGEESWVDPAEESFLQKRRIILSSLIRQVWGCYLRSQVLIRKGQKTLADVWKEAQGIPEGRGSSKKEKNLNGGFLGGVWGFYLTP